jgi:hypothetical protein
MGRPLEAFVAKIGSPGRRFVVASVAVFVSGAIVALSLLGRDKDLTALSIAVAVLFGTVTSLQNAHMHRRAHTIKLLTAFSTAETLSASDYRMARIIASGRRIDDDVDAETDMHVINLLDYYEFICCAALHRHIDPAIVVELRGSAMRAAYAACSPYLAARRDRISKGLYSGYHKFLAEHDLLPAPSATDPRAAPEHTNVPHKPAAESAKQ